MSKLDELIRELCPEGVEYKTLGEIGKFYGGLTGKSKKDFEDGNEVFITYKNVYSNPALDIYPNDKVKIADGEKQRTLEYGDIVFTGSSETPDECGFSSVVTRKPGRKLYLNSFCFFFRLDNPKVLLPDFSKHLFRSSELRIQIGKTASGVTRYNVSKDKMAKVEIPLPPLEIQREIVRILDNFTNLTAELTAELTARKAQYSHYRDKLLSYTSTAQMEKLGDTCEMKAGKAIASGLISDECTEETPIKCYGGNGVRGYVKNANENGSYPIIGRQGALCGNVKYAEGQFYATEHAVVVKPKEKYNPRFLYHLLTNMNLNQYKSAGAQPGLAVKNIAELVAPVPPLNVQNRIVNVLDNFEKICSDLNIGLPAEIEARQKQYEYYRDKLLTFAETGNTILSRAEQSRAEQSRAEQSRAEQSRALIKLLQYVFGYAVVTLEDIAENCDSMRKPVTSGKREAGEYPYYGASGIVDYVKDYIFDGDYLLVSEDGANLLARSTPIAFSISGKNWVNNHAHVLKFGCYETRRFVEFYLNSIDLAPYISGGAQPKLNQKNLNRIEIPLPSQERQKYIVDILDRFDAICNDLTSGLPAEIEARQKQYEYYRDKLLNF